MLFVREGDCGCCAPLNSLDLSVCASLPEVSETFWTFLTYLLILVDRVPQNMRANER